MARYELWRQEHNGIAWSFTAAERRVAALATFDPGGPEPDLIWQVDADSWDEAMTRYHDYMGWEPYRPIHEA